MPTIFQNQNKYIFLNNNGTFYYLKKWSTTFDINFNDLIVDYINPNVIGKSIIIIPYTEISFPISTSLLDLKNTLEEWVENEYTYNYNTGITYGNQLSFSGNSWMNSINANQILSGNTNLANIFISNAQSVGDASPILKQKSGMDLIFKTISAGTNTTVINTNDTITIQTSGTSFGNGSFGITIDGGGNEITTGAKGYIMIPYSGTITRWDLLSDQSGDIVIDVYKESYNNYPPNASNTITGTQKPTLTSALKNQNTNLTNWITTVNANDIFVFNVDSVSIITKVTLTIQVSKN